jgi:membrane-associated phospholipid phosphatase
MSRRAPIHLRPTRADVAIARASARCATPKEAKTLQALTFLADEKLLIAGAALFWGATRLGRCDGCTAREADRMLLSVAIASALPHLLKHVFARERPDRTVGRRRRSIPRSGQAWDSFPSGHAMHIGAIAGPLLRLVPRRLRPAVLPALISLAASRVLLLAHYPSDVAAGLGIGVAIERGVSRLLPGGAVKRRLDRSRK